MERVAARLVRLLVPLSGVKSDAACLFFLEGGGALATCLQLFRGYVEGTRSLRRLAHRQDASHGIFAFFWPGFCPFWLCKNGPTLLPSSLPPKIWVQVAGEG